MSVFSRFTDIVNSNINSILDDADDPEKMVRLITREMQETLVQARSMSAQQLAEKKRVTLARERTAHAVQSWDSKAELAISRGREDLAKAAIAERQRCESEVIEFEGEIVQLDAHLANLKTDIATLEEKLASAKTREAALIMRGRAAKSRVSIRRQLSDGRVTSAMERFEEYERRIDELEGDVESFDIAQSRAPASLSYEISRLEESEDVTNELARLKARVCANRKQGHA